MSNKIIKWHDINDSSPPDCPSYVLGFKSKLYLIYYSLDDKAGLQASTVGLAQWIYSERQFKNDKRLKITHWAKVNLPGIVDAYVS